MKTIKQDIGSKDCLACVAAMATGTTVEKFKEYYKDNNLPFDSDITFIRYIWDNGYMTGVFAPEDNLFSKSDLGHVDLLYGPAYLVVESENEWVRNQGASHAVYWDGEKVHDPSPTNENPKLSKYKIISCMNIVKASEVAE